LESGTTSPAHMSICAPHMVYHYARQLITASQSQTVPFIGMNYYD
jgi:hypothetical protein